MRRLRELLVRIFLDPPAPIAAPTEPTPAEIRDFIVTLRNKASFTRDVDLTSAADFIQRMYDYAQMRATAPSAASDNLQPADLTKKIA